MKIIRDQQLATLTLVPVEAEEEQVFATITAMLKPEDNLAYGGRSQEGDGSKFFTLSFHAGSHPEEKVEIDGSTTFHSMVQVGGVKLVLRGSTEDDKYEINNIRNICFYGHGGLIFLGETEVDGKKAIITTGMRCEHCGVWMITALECEWSTCGACAEKCEHNFGARGYCDKCGRLKPKAVSA